MKKSILSFIVVLFALFASNSTYAQPASGAEIDFTKKTHDYGTIKNGADGTCTFEFKNTGNAPLIIQDAKGSCGCTVPEWPKTPIAPGATAEITVKYDTTRAGAINKDVTVITNAVNEPTVTLRIKGNVLPKPSTPSPSN